MLATLNSKQIVDEIVKDTIKDNDPHDALQISPDVVFASRPNSDPPALAPEAAKAPQVASRPEPKINLAFVTPAMAPSVDTAVRAAAGDLPSRRKRSSVGKWLTGAFVTFLFAAGSAAATVAWEKHGDTAKQMMAEWVPPLTSLLTTSTSQTTAAATEQAAQPVPQAPTDQIADQSATPPAAPATPSAAQATPPAAQDTAATAAPDATQSVQAMTRDLAAMAQQIEQLKTNIAELKTGQEQMAREMAKTAAPKPAEAKPVEPPRARVSALPARPAAAPVRRPKPVAAPAYVPTYAPAPIAPPPSSQAVAVPPPSVAPVSSQAVADDDGPVVRPPMPVR